MSTRYLQQVAATCGAAIVLAVVVSCGSGKPMPNIEEDVTIPRMTIGETITGEPEVPAGDTQAPTTPPTTPQTPRATPPVSATPPPDFGHPH
ncbi:hypothetical protein [Mycolicibacterium setense]|uniref:hypothetical protein n=1 Tax=Mycolicibacterium setense TaxID=431269 RepID=UPI000B28D35B|nr:hypothetical protein [Mycolicibacterium setense]